MSAPPRVLAIGRVVHYVLPAREDPLQPGDHRPAMVVRVLNGARANLAVFVDGVADTGAAAEIIQRQLDVPLDPEGRPNTWHWPEMV